MAPTGYGKALGHRIAIVVDDYKKRQILFVDILSGSSVNTVWCSFATRHGFRTQSLRSKMFTEIKLKRAVSYNKRRANVVGWPRQYQLVSSQLGLGAIAPTPDAFAAAVYQWQLNFKGAKLKPDGKLGKNTLLAMKIAGQQTGGSGQAPAWLYENQLASFSGKPTGGGPRWLQYAQGEMHAWNQAIESWADEDRAGDAELYATRDNEYFLCAPYCGGKVQERGFMPRNDLRRHWCAAFVNWCLHSAGYSHTGSAGAHSFITPRLWRFEALREPRQGCVCVVGDGDRASHVGFIWNSKNLPEDPDGHVEMTGDRLCNLLGGNQSDRVNIRPEKKRLMACRGHNGVTSPYLWPLRGTPTCDHNPSTEAAHFCGRTHGD